MKMILTLAAALMLFACAMAPETVTHLKRGHSGWISYPSSVPGLTLRGHLTLPEKAQGGVPAMIIAHSSGVLDARDERWAKFLAEHGIAAFRIDYFGPRGVTWESETQPTPSSDAREAFRLLATHPRIDASRIGVIGFSRGGNLAIETANRESEYVGGRGFAAHVALYPGCGYVPLLKGGSGAPVLVLAGALDELVPPSHCRVLVRQGREAGREVELKVYEGAHHGWDGDMTGSYFHRAIKRAYRLSANADVTRESRQDVLQFLRAAFARR